TPPGERSGSGEAPVKLCPQDEGGCGSLVHASVRCCPDCGFEFPINDEPKIESTAADTPMLSKDNPTWRPVTKRTFRFHEGKPGKKDSVKVTYFQGLTQFNDWYGPAHDGFFKSKTDRFWARHGGQRPFPSTVMEFLERQGELLETAEIQVLPDGRYWTVR